MLKKESESVGRSVLSDSLQPHELWPARLLCPWDSPGKNTGVGCHFLLQGIPGSTPCLLHCRQILYGLRHQGRSHTQHWVFQNVFGRTLVPQDVKTYNNTKKDSVMFKK